MNTNTYRSNAIIAGILYIHMPLAVQEMVLAVWFIVKGFSPSALAAGAAKTDSKGL